MKKRVIAIISICLLLAGLSTVQAISVNDINVKKQTLETKDFTADPDDAPDWAAGNFTGTWGLNFWGNDWFPAGPVRGYYGKGFLYNYKIGRFLIEYKETGEENGTTFEGLFIGPYLLGKTTNQETGNSSAFVGLGGYNETHYRWRIMGIEGPTLFMRGTFNEFQ